MRGYTVKKGKQYYAVIYEGIDPSTGKERRRWIPGGSRRGDAEKLLTELVKRNNDGHRAPADKISFGDYLIERWLPLQQAQLRPSTYDSYRRNLELHVIPAIGRIPLQKLAPEDLDTLYARLLTKGRRNGAGGLSVKTVHSIHLVIHKALKDALRKGSVIRNVAEAADPPKLSSAKRHETKVWTAEQLRAFLDMIAAHRLYAAFHVTSHTGMRRGEILGLRWSDVDLDAARISVRQAVISVAYELQLSDVKTGSGRRNIDLDRDTVGVLRQWKKRQTEERLAHGSAYVDHGLAFSKPVGEPIHPDIFSQTFDRVVARSRLPVITLHDLRHTHATLLLKAGVPVKVVSERLGHANPAFTMSVYQHVIPGMQAEAAEIFAKLTRPSLQPKGGTRTPLRASETSADPCL
jgi:integrase